MRRDGAIVPNADTRSGSQSTRGRYAPDADDVLSDTPTKEKEGMGLFDQRMAKAKERSDR